MTYEEVFQSLKFNMIVELKYKDFLFKHWLFPEITLTDLCNKMALC